MKSLYNTLEERVSEKYQPCNKESKESEYQPLNKESTESAY